MFLNKNKLIFATICNCDVIYRPNRRRTAARARPKPSLSMRKAVELAEALQITEKMNGEPLALSDNINPIQLYEEFKLEQKKNR